MLSADTPSTAHSPRHTPRLLRVEDRGLETYATTYERQKKAVAEVKAGGEELLFLVEHPEVYTAGRKAADQAHDPTLPWIAVERGGEATYHNPGQLVAYPILKLEGSARDLHAYLRNLEEVLIRVLADFGLPGERRAGATGVWIQGREKKIASIGVAVSSWVTYHGIALNVCNDLNGFARIHPCGFSAEVMTSLEHELQAPCPMDAAKRSLLRHFSEVFGRACE